MEELETIFQKINRESYDLKNHKRNLGLILQNNKYFKKRTNTWDLRMAFASISFALLIIIGTISYSPQTISKNNLSNNSILPLYDRLLKNNNTNIAGGNTIEITQENIRTTLYFDNNKKLINSITNK
jgi:hypothetical protein